MKAFFTECYMLLYSLDKGDAPPDSTANKLPSDVDSETKEEPVAKEQEGPPSVVSGPSPSTIPPIPPVPGEFVSHYSSFTKTC